MKWLVKAAFLASTMIVVPVALSAQQNSVPDMLGVGEKLGSQGQRITTLEQTAQDTKKEIHEFKENVNKQFDEVNKRFDKIEQLIANSTAETNARFEKYFNQTDTRLKTLEQPWGTNVFSNLMTDPLMVGASLCTYVGVSLLVKDNNNQNQAKPGVGAYILLGASTLFSAQALWNAFSPPIQYALVSSGAFIMVAAGGIYKLSENPAGVVNMVQKVSGLAGLVSIGGVIYKMFDTTSAAKKKNDL